MHFRSDETFRVTKEFPVKERYRFSVFSEFFNVFNISHLLYSNFTLDTVKAVQTYAFGQPSNRLGQIFSPAEPELFNWDHSLVSDPSTVSGSF